MIPAPATAAKGRHDFETYSEAGFVWHDDIGKWKPLATTKKRGLPAVGRKPYFQHPSADVLCYSYILPTKPMPQRWRPGQAVPLDLCLHIGSGGIMEAWNAAFERGAWNELMVKRYGFPELPLRQTRCAMARARAFSLPGALEAAGAVVGADVQKDKRGKALLDKFSKPRNPTKTDPRRRILPAWDPDTTVALYRAQGYDPSTFPKGWYVTDHADTMALAEYCDTDVQAEEAVSRVTPELTGEELEFWFADQAIIERGVHVDTDGVRSCIAIIEQAHALYNAELQRITACSLDGEDDDDEEGVASASKVKQLLEWLARRGVTLESLDEETVTDALKQETLTPETRRVLEIRQLIGSASVKKVYAMLTTVARDDRIHDLFNYHAARTGRVTGDGAQPTNMPNSGPAVLRCGCGRHHRVTATACPWCGSPVAPGAKPEEWSFEAACDALEVIGSQQLRLVEHFMGDAMAVVSGCLRLLFDAAPGHDLISADYSSIEAVVLAMLAGVQWRIDVFRTHGRIYEASAAQMFGVSFEEIMAGAGYTPEELALPEWWKRKPAAPTGKHHSLRKLGKVAELALGYLGWIGAAKNFDMPGTDEEIKQNILKWRDASPEIVELGGGQTRRIGWERMPELFGIEGAFVRAIREPGTWWAVRRRDGSDTGIAYFGTPDRTVFCRLPSGRNLTYHRCELNYSRRPYAQAWEVSISYEGYNTNPKNGKRGWIRMDTYAGKLMENVVQATARDILRYAIVNLERAGYAVVLHVYDEIVSEIRRGWGSIEEFVRIMGTMPDWAKDWPIRVGEPWRGQRYRK